MSLKRNVLAGYLNQFYVALIGIVMLPMYLQYMGAEAYGLVGFFALLQAWFGLLDMGLTPTMSRESARFHGGALGASDYLQFVRMLEWVFGAIAFVGGGLVVLFAGYIAQRWLQVSQLSIGEVQNAVKVMGVVVAMRWMGGLYRGAINGAEKLVWLGVFNALIATVRFVGVIPVLILVDPTPVIFFNYQFLVAVIELVGLATYAYHLFPAKPSGFQLVWNLMPLRPRLRFSLTIAFTSSVWVLVTQTDKLVLSKLLPLSEYGYFTLAVLIASSVTMMYGPISNALMPRMARLEAEGDRVALIQVYRQSTQIVAVLAGAVSVTLAVCAEPLMWVWTGNHLLAYQAAPVLSLYALGNGILSVAAFPYYLQYAIGNLRLHFIGNALFVIFLMPSIIWGASHYGGQGAGWAWLIMNLIVFVVWLPFVHHTFVPGLNRKWYVQDTLVIFIATGFVGYELGNLLPGVNVRSEQLGWIFLLGLAVLFAGVCASSEARGYLKTLLQRNKMVV